MREYTSKKFFGNDKNFLRQLMCVGTVLYTVDGWMFLKEFQLVKGVLLSHDSKSVPIFKISNNTSE